jgi:hypothetical protein
VDARVAALSDRDVKAVLQELTDDLAAPDVERAVADEDEARHAIAAVLALDESARAVDASSLAPEDAAEAGRRLLEELLADDAVAEDAEDLVADPPRDHHLGIDPGQVEMQLVVLGAIITWLETKVSVRIHRERPDSSIDVEIEKDRTDPEVLRSLVSAVRRVFSPGE